MRFMVTPAIEEISSYTSLLSAFKRAEKNCRRSLERARFVYHLPENLKLMSDDLKAGIYQFGSYSEKIVIDPKRRIIHKAPFRDRILHQAIHAYLEADFDKRMIDQSYACRKHKGTIAAAKNVFKWSRQFDYALKLDMAKYFSSINHRRLLEKISPLVIDKGLYQLIELLIASFPNGLPIGSLTSQLFANWYLNDLDHFIKRELKVGAYARYMDDLILFSDSKCDLWRLADAIKAFAGVQEYLSIPMRKTILLSTEKGGVPFLGYWFFKSKMPRLQQRSLKGQKRRLLKLRSGHWSESEYLSSAAGWWGHASYALNCSLAKDLGVKELEKSFKKRQFL